MPKHWKDVVGYDGLYQVSDRGEVRSLERLAKSRNKGMRLVRARILCDANVKGYRYVHLSKNGEHKMHGIHRLMARAFIQENVDGLTVNHKDGIKHRNVLANLELVSIQKNIQHAFETGLRNSTGEHNPKAKLSPKQVIEIRNLLSRNISVEIIANCFHVQKPCIWKIQHGRTWAHLI